MKTHLLATLGLLMVGCPNSGGGGGVGSGQTMAGSSAGTTATSDVVLHCTYDMGGDWTATANLDHGVVTCSDSDSPSPTTVAYGERCDTTGHPGDYIAFARVQSGTVLLFESLAANMRKWYSVQTPWACTSNGTPLANERGAVALDGELPSLPGQDVDAGTATATATGTCGDGLIDNANGESCECPVGATEPCVVTDKVCSDLSPGDVGTLLCDPTLCMYVTTRCVPPGSG